MTKNVEETKNFFFFGYWKMSKIVLIYIYRGEVRNLEELLINIEKIGKKLDIILDYITMQQEKEEEELQQIRQLQRRMIQNEVQILDHEKRIVVLEKRMLKN